MEIKEPAFTWTTRPAITWCTATSSCGLGINYINIILDCPTGILFQKEVARSLEYYRRFLGYMTGHLVWRNIICPREDNGDLQPQPDSPALRLGFQPIPFKKIGIRG